jgi:hypothetical protein
MRKVNARQFLLDVVITMPITFVVAAAVTYMYSLIAHGTGAIDWDTAFRLAIILGIVLPLTRSLQPKEGS